MKLFILTLTLAVFRCGRVEDCVLEVKGLTHTVFDIVIESMRNEYVPDKQALYDLMKLIQGTAKVCADKEIDAEKYDPCINRIYPTLSELENAIRDGMIGDYHNMAINIVKLILDLTNGISYCIDINN